MSSDVREVRVDIRHHTLATAAALRETDDGEVFITLSDPPPVRSCLSIFEGDAGPHALEVTRVVEVANDDATVGLFGRFRDVEALAANEKVGTEHLEAGEAGNVNVDADHSAGLAMPAPVVDPDPSDRIDVSELQQLESEAAARAEAEAAASDDAANDAAAEGGESSDEREGHGTAESAASEEPAASDNDGNESPRRGRKRRGRKRR